MTWHLRNEGHLVNEKRIRRLMRLMSLMPIYQKPNTSRAAKGPKTYPYLLRGLRVTRPNQVWAADITYLPPLGRFALQIACRAADAAWVPVSGGDPLPDRVMRSMIPRGMDWHTRKVLAWRISNTLEADVCPLGRLQRNRLPAMVAALNEAIHRFGPPERAMRGNG